MFALFNVFCTCLENVSFLSRVTPRYLTVGAQFSALPLMIICLVRKVDRLVKKIVVDFSALILIFQLCALGL